MLSSLFSCTPTRSRRSQTIFNDAQLSAAQSRYTLAKLKLDELAGADGRSVLGDTTKADRRKMLKTLIEEQMRLAVRLGHDPLAVLTEEHVDFCLGQLAGHYSEARDIIYNASSVEHDAAVSRCSDLESKAQRACYDTMSLLLRTDTDYKPSFEDYADQFVNAYIALTRWQFAEGHYRQEVVKTGKNGKKSSEEDKRGDYGEVEKLLESFGILLNEAMPTLSTEVSATHLDRLLADIELLGVIGALYGDQKTRLSAGNADAACTWLVSAIDVSLSVFKPEGSRDLSSDVSPARGAPESPAAEPVFERSLVQCAAETAKERGAPCDFPYLFRAITRLHALSIVTEHLEVQRGKRIEAAARAKVKEWKRENDKKQEQGGACSPGLAVTSPIASNGIEEVSFLGGAPTQDGG